MKKLKKLLAGVITLAMAMSMMTMTAFAANTYSDSQGLTTSTIDTNQSGSLTIYKYGKEEGDTFGGKDATGAHSDQAGLPDDKLLNDVEFSIYQVMDTEAMMKYYSGKTGEVALPDVMDYVTAPVEPNKAWTVDDLGKTPFKGTEVTGKDGIKGAAIFENLPLGIYLVVETKVPDSVTTSVEPFLVSIPMTTVEGDKWLYDVEVFPKNETAYGGLELEKLAMTGGDKESATPLAGVTFKLYKKDDYAEGGWKPIISAPANGTDNGGIDDYTLVTDEYGKISIDGLSSGDYYFIEDSLGDNGEKNGYILDQKTKYEFNVNGSTITFKNSDQVASGTKDGKTIQWLRAYNDRPDVDKEVQDGHSEAENWVDETDYNFGDTIPYKVTVKVPANIGDLREFILTDEPDGLKDDVNSIAIEGLYKGQDYTVTEVGAGFKITFTTSAANVKAKAGQEIVITYNATLTADAAVTTPENPNTVKLEYSSKIVPDGEPDPTRKEIHDGAVVYSFAIKIDKVNDEREPLKGVEFDLYREVESNVTGAMKGDTIEGAGLDANKYFVKVNTTDKLITDANGNITQTGLADGKYWLVETKTATGYNLLKAPVEIVLDYVYETKWTKTEEFDKDGVLIKQEYKEVIIRKDDKVITDAENLNAGTLLETVVNKHGFELPTTGGMGTFLFTFVGVAMMAAAVILFFTSKKKEAK